MEVLIFLGFVSSDAVCLQKIMQLVCYIKKGFFVLSYCGSFGKSILEVFPSLFLVLGTLFGVALRTSNWYLETSVGMSCFAMEASWLILGQVEILSLVHFTGLL